MLDKDVAPTSNNSSSSNRSLFNKPECDNSSRDIVDSSNTSSAFVVPATINRQLYGLTTVPFDLRNRNSANVDSEFYQTPHKRRRLDSIINNLNYCGNNGTTQRRYGLLSSIGSDESGANQVGDISSTTSINSETSFANNAQSVLHSSSLIPRPFAIQLNHKREDIDNYQNIVNHSTLVQQPNTSDSEQGDSSVINLSYYAKNHKYQNSNIVMQLFNESCNSELTIFYLC